MIFNKPSGEQPHNLRCLFLCFEAASGLKINLSKSEIVLIGDVGDVEGLTSILGCRVASLPIKYLGFLRELLTRLLPFGMALLTRWNIGWRIGRGFIYQREAN